MLDWGSQAKKAKRASYVVCIHMDNIHKILRIIMAGGFMYHQWLQNVNCMCAD